MPKRRKLKPLERREALWGLLFISPWLIGFVLFTFLPTLATLIFSFTNFNLSSTAPFAFVGLKNYQDMLAGPAGVGVAAGHVHVRRALAADDADRAVPGRGDAQQPQPARRRASSAS